MTPFFLSGTVICLLEFVELATSEFDSVSAVQNAERGRHHGGGEGNKGGHNSGRSNKSCEEHSGSINSSSYRHEEADVDVGAGRVGNLCDALTFAVGCLKNVSATSSLQHKLVQAGAVDTLCRLVCRTCDLCRRCDEAQRRASPNCRAYTEQSDGLLNASGQPSFEIGEPRLDGNVLIRRRVSPYLAQAINLLRDVVAGKDKHDETYTSGVVGALCSILRLFRNQHDVVLNAARTLAKLSLQEGKGGESILYSVHARDLLAALVEQGREIINGFSKLKNNGDGPHTTCGISVERRQHWEKEGKRVAACVRLAFALGNLTSASDDNRKLVGLRFGGAEALPALLQMSSRAHVSAWESLCAVENAVAENDASVDARTGTRGSGAVCEEPCWARKTLRSTCDGLEEMLVNTVRLLANISINREVGQRVCQHAGLVTLEPLLGKCLDVFALFEDGVLPHVPRLYSEERRCRESSKVRSATIIIPGEELLLNIVSLVTNLSFYGPRANNREPIGYSCSGSIRGSLGNRSGNRCDMESFPTSEFSYRNTLFTLASMPRRGVEEEALPKNSKSVVGDKSSGGGAENRGGVDRPRKVTASCYSNHVLRREMREVLCGHLVKVLLHPNPEVVAEAARAFGNFSRDPSCREEMARRRADEVLVVLLGHACREVVFAAAGALVNVAADPARKALLYRESVDAGDKLTRLLRRAGLADSTMAELACQALYNLLIDPLPAGGVEQAVGGAETHRKLWWTLRELIEASSCEDWVDGRGDGGIARPLGGGGGREDASGCLGGFPAAAAAVWRVINNGSANRVCALLYAEQL